MSKDLRQYALFLYSLSNLKQKDKVKTIRELFGYKDNKKGKVYSHSGMLESLECRKLGSNVICVPIEHTIKFSNFFNSKDIKFNIEEVWI
ncbi:MAG: hypothetical protein KJ601_07895 [Nanoarchaeota archaeon]|nr:hypothetical protein [Nanoarchaeota archaeon]MBU1703742.1 hypothetical protein [Nanoarchaeota archaeon]